MKYVVLVQPPAEDDIAAIWEWIAERAPTSADRWLAGLIEAMGSLQQHPRRCSLAPESRFFKRRIRQLLYGKGRRKSRILFAIRPGRVHVLHVRHWSQNILAPGDGD